MGLQQRKSRWIGHESSAQQLLPLTRSLLQQCGEGAIPVAGTVPNRTAAADLDTTTKAETKFLPKLSADLPSSVRAVGGAKTTGKLLSRANTAGALSSYKSQEASRKFFLLKGE